MSEKEAKNSKEAEILGLGVGASGDAGDTGRNRMTADVSHVYFYSVSRFLWRRITAKQTCPTSAVYDRVLGKRLL